MLFKKKSQIKNQRDSGETFWVGNLEVIILAMGNLGYESISYLQYGCFWQPSHHSPIPPPPPPLLRKNGTSAIKFWNDSSLQLTIKEWRLTLPKRGLDRGTRYDQKQKFP